MTPAGHGWKTSAMHRLGSYWQRAGDYARADAAYAELLRDEPKDQTALYNRALTQIRNLSHRAALDTIARLADELKLPAQPDDLASLSRKQFKPARRVVYLRALALHYTDDHIQAEAWSRALALQLLEGPQEEEKDMERLEQSALMLHAGTTVGLAHWRAEVDDDPKAREIVADAIQGAATGGTHLKIERTELVPRIRDRDVDVARSIEAYVRYRADDDPRASYNLACYTARLARYAPTKAGALHTLARNDCETAFSDPSLVPWARKDPSLKPLKEDHRWQVLLNTYETAGAATAPATDVEPAPGLTDVPAPDRAVPVDPEMDRARYAVIEQTRLVVEKLAVHAGAATIDGLNALAQQAMTMSDDQFHAELGAILAADHDSCTAYLCPKPHRDMIATLPLRLAAVLADGRREYVVAAAKGAARPSLPVGTVVTHWNDQPVADVVERLAARLAAATADARRARAIAALTHRPIGLLGPPPDTEVRIGCRADGKDLETTLKWETERVPPSPATERDQISRDELVEIIRRTQSRAFVDLIPPAAAVEGSRPAVLRVRTFDVPDVDAFLEHAAAALRGLPPDGLIVDVRGNAGGRIEAAEGLLQFICPREVRPAPLQFATTSLTEELLKVLGHEDADDADAKFSDPVPLSAGHAAHMNAIGQIYFGPAVLLADALSSGATDFLLAGFADHELGPIVCADGEPGGAGHEAWSHAALHEHLKESGLEPLPFDGARLRISVRRAVRVGRHVGQPLEDRPVRPAHVHHTTREELDNGVDGALAAAKARLTGGRPRFLEAWLPADTPEPVLRIASAGITRVDVYTGDRPLASRDIRATGYDEDLKLPHGIDPADVVVQGFAGDEPAARVRVAPQRG